MSKKELQEDLLDILKNSPVIYKYVSSDVALLILENLNLKLSNPQNFNDPFDCYSELISFDNIPHDYLESLKLKYQNKFPLLTEKINKIEKLHSKSEMVKTYRTFAFPQVLSKIAVTCFSKTYLEPLMWSHYANSHSGVCIGFNVLKLYHSLESKTSRGLFKVNYCENFETKDFFLDKFESIIHCLSTKSNDWGYEKEVRLIYTNLNLDDNNEVFLTFKFEAIEELIFGANFKIDENLELINKIKCDFGYVNKFKMTLQKNSFNLGKEKIYLE